MSTLWHKSKALMAGHLLRRVALCGLVAGAFCVPSAAKAGFEWIAPEDNGPVFPAPQMPVPETVMPMPAPAPVPLPMPQDVMPYAQPVPMTDMTAMPVPVSPAPGSSALQIYQQPVPVPLVNVPAHTSVMPVPPVQENYVPPVIATMPAVPMPQDMSPVRMDPRQPVIPAYGRHPSVTSIYAAQLNGVAAVPGVFEEPYEIVEGFGSEIPLVLVMSLRLV